jgi:hypothetical protein
MVLIYLFLTKIDVSASRWKLRPQNHSIPVEGKYEVAKCCLRLEWNTLCLSRQKAHAKGLGLCGWLKALL